MMKLAREQGVKLQSLDFFKLWDFSEALMRQYALSVFKREMQYRSRIFDCRESAVKEKSLEK